MPLFLAILVAVLVFLIWVRRAGPGAGPPRRRAARCAFERVDPNSDRALQEYRCRNCGETAYGRADRPPADRTCKAGSLT